MSTLVSEDDAAVADFGGTERCFFIVKSRTS
jgi:hypothetical protein